MTTRSLFAFTIASVFALALCGCAKNEMWGQRGDKEDDDAKEQQVNMDQLPQSVRTTLDAESRGGQVQEIEKMTWKGRTVYEADVMADGKKWEIMIREDGQMLRKMLDEEDDAEDDKNEKDD